MDIALLNVRITFQKAEVTADAIGNRINTWTDYYSCYATVSGEGGTEQSAAGQTVDYTDASFTIRFCKPASEINTTEFRVCFGNEIYNILSIDHMNFKKKTMKFKCQKVRR